MKIQLRPSSPCRGIFAKVFLCYTFFSLLLTGGCATTVTEPSVRLALDGPPLSIAAEDDSGFGYAGNMDRSCMAGVGSMLLYGGETGISCQGRMDRPATDKGRLYIELSCSDGRAMTVAMRNLGPDQGMGVGRFAGASDTILLFYHACELEARRRLDLLQNDIQTARADREKKKVNATTIQNLDGE